MNKKKVLLEISFKDSLSEGNFDVTIMEHTDNIVLGDCIEVKIEHDQDQELCFYETFHKENFPQNFFESLPNDWDYVLEKIQEGLKLT